MLFTCFWFSFRTWYIQVGAIRKKQDDKTPLNVERKRIRTIPPNMAYKSCVIAMDE